MKTLYPVTAIFAVALVKEGFVLVHDSDKPAPIRFKNPGGQVEIGETPMQALEREISKEECVGLATRTAKEFFVIDNHKKQFSILFYFISEPEISVSEIQKGAEIDILKAVPKKEVEIMIAWGDILPQHATAIMKAVERFF